MKTVKLFKRLAQLAEQHSNCITANNTEWKRRSQDEIEQLVKDYLPSGSGVDNGTKFDFDASMKQAGKVLVFNTAYHHMNENGMYDGWTEHAIIVKPSLAHDFSLSVSGKDRNEIKEYLAEIYSSALSDEYWSLREAYFRTVESDPLIKITNRWINQCKQVWEIGLVNIEFGTFQAAVNWLNENGRLG